MNMVSVNYNMKINTKKTKILRVSKGSESDNEASNCMGNDRTSQGILLLRKHDLRWCHREIKRRIATTASIWFEIWAVVDPGKKISISTGKFPKNFNFWGNFTKEYRVLQANFRKFWFFQAIKKIRFSKQKIVHWQLATSGQIILFLFKSNHFRTYFLYISAVQPAARGPHAARRLMSCGPPVLAKFVRN